ncbi:hypothetical protein BH23BAC2_BH23BAC2_10680 [soil metagenome]
MRKFSSLLIIVILVSCSNGKKEEKTDSRTGQKIATNNSEENWTDLTKDSIPESLNEALINFNKGNFELANPNDRYNATDIIVDSLPRQKLSLLSKKGNKWRLTYVQGGFAKYYVYTQCEIRNDSVYDLKIAKSVLILENNDSIDKYLSEKKLEPKNVKITRG